MIGLSSRLDFKKLAHNNIVTHYPVTLYDVSNAYKFFGPDLAGKGEMPSEKTGRVITDYIEIPQDLLKKMHAIMLAVDLMFVNQVSFFVTF